MERVVFNDYIIFPDTLPYVSWASRRKTYQYEESLQSGDVVTMLY